MWLINRLGEASTWRGIALILGVAAHCFGIPLPEVVSGITAAVGAIETLRSEK